MGSPRPPRFLPRSGGAWIGEGGTSLSSGLKGTWQGSLAEGPSIAKGSVGRFDVRVGRGLVRLGWAAPGGSVDGLGTDCLGFGFGGTGKKSHGGRFEDFGEVFGAGDVVGCKLDRRGGRFCIEYSKNGRGLGAAFDFSAADGQAGLSDVALLPAVTGRQFEAELCQPIGGEAFDHSEDANPAFGAASVVAEGGNGGRRLLAATEAACEELQLPVAYYVAAASAAISPEPGFAAAAAGALQKKKAKTSQPAIAGEVGIDLCEFFLGRSGDGDSSRANRAALAGESYANQWVRSALAQPRVPEPSVGDFRGCRDIRRVIRTVMLPSGQTLSLVDSQPADRNAADRCFAQSVALWESLPRGHSEVRLGSPDGKLLTQIVGLRKFGSAEEKFGPLAQEAGGSRRAALEALPAALDLCTETKDWTAHAVFLTKENGEMCKISFFEVAGAPYIAVASKNVVLAVSAANLEVARVDLQAYKEDRFEFAVEMAEVFLEHFFTSMNVEQRADLIRFAVEHQATFCGESISPLHQHIQSYRTDGAIRPQIRFFAVTSPLSYDRFGLTLVDPQDALQRMRSWGLDTVEACDEAPLADLTAVHALEEKHMFLPNREGAVVYIVIRPPPGDAASHSSRTALVYKWKNAWYVTVRAMRQKIFAKASEARIRNRIGMLHLHHPQEASIVEDYLGFYRWALLLLPSSSFRDVLGSFWVSLKSAFDTFSGEEENEGAGNSGLWDQVLPKELTSKLSPDWLRIFPAVHSALAAGLPKECWTPALVARRKLLDEAVGSQAGVERTVESFIAACAAKRGEAQAPQAPLPATALPLAEGGEEVPVGLTVVLVRGLQGSGKSTLCRALRAVVGGQWVNQDEVAAALGRGRGGPTPREAFLRAVEVAVGRQENRYVFVDKIHTLRQHREDVREAIVRGEAVRAQAAGSRVAVALFDLVHAEDDEGLSTKALPVCSKRIASRGLGHLSFVPQASAVEDVVQEAANRAEVLSDDEKCGFDVYADLDLTLSAEELLAAALGRLETAQLLAPENHGSELSPSTHAEAVAAALDHESSLQSRWRTRYWHLQLSWPSLLFGATSVEAAVAAAGGDAAANVGAAGAGGSSEMAHRALREAMEAALKRCASAAEAEPALGAGGLQAVEDPHVTLLWLGDREPEDEETKRADSQLSEQEGQEVDVDVTAVAFDAGLGLITLRVCLGGGPGGRPPPACANEHPHVTAAKRPEVAAVTSNDLLVRQAAGGDPSVEQIDLVVPLRVRGTITRQLAVESMAFVPAGLPEVGNPVCELGLATTGEAVDIVATYNQGIRWRRLLRTFDRLFCAVTEPLQVCRGWPPKLRGKQWFTFHETPLGVKSLAALRGLEHSGQLQSVHIGAVYCNVPGLLEGDKDGMCAKLKARLEGAGTGALEIALQKLREVRAVEEERSEEEAVAEEEEEGEQAEARPPPMFYVQCKRVGSTELTTQLKQAAAATISGLMGWEPVLKGADITISLGVREDWLLISLLLPRSAAAATDVGEQRERALAARPMAVSKAMTQILRHTALSLGVAIRPDGFCRIGDVLSAKPLKRLGATQEDLEQAVRDSDKKRFEIKEMDGELFVRATQGHSIKDVEDAQLLQPLSLADADLPEICAHGTYQRHLPQIGSQGLLAGGQYGGRNHIHFVPYEPHDERVISGMRYNCEVILYIDLRRAIADGIPFFMSSNDVLLSPGADGAIAPEYIEKVWDLRRKAWLPFPPAMAPPLPPVIGDEVPLLQKGLVCAPEEEDTLPPMGLQGCLALDAAELGGGGWLLRMAPALAAATSRGFRFSGRFCGRGGLRGDDVAAVRVATAGAEVAGLEEGSTEVLFTPALGGLGAGLHPDLPSDALDVNMGLEGSTMLGLQALLPLMLRRSASLGGTGVAVKLRGNTNAAGSPQVDYAQRVLAPMLKRLFNASLDLRIQSRGFQKGVGEVEAVVASAAWPLPAFELVSPGEAAGCRGVAMRTSGVPPHVLPRLLEGQLKKKAVGAAIRLRTGLPRVDAEWERVEVETTDGNDGCSVLVVVETTSGCLIAGDSHGRKGVPAEKVGEEAASAAIVAVEAGACVDEHLEDQLLIFMALAAGTSRLRLGIRQPSTRTLAGLRLLEKFGIASRWVEDSGGRVLEVDGIGEKL